VPRSVLEWAEYVRPAARGIHNDHKNDSHAPKNIECSVPIAFCFHGDYVESQKVSTLMDTYYNGIIDFLGTL
jgi:hypothetical protein